MRLSGRTGRALTGMLLAGLMLTGCSRATINYQVAESIGTLGQFENNEPVETPRMRQERELRELQESEAEVFAQELHQAQTLVDSYRYEEAIEYLEQLERNETNSEQIDEKIAEYQELFNGLKVWDGNVTHICFPTLIEDPSRAFDGDDYAYTYASSMVTVNEFEAILQTLYEKGYVLIGLEDIAALETDERNVTTLEKQQLLLPDGKRPLILSQDNVNYSSVRNGDGIATKLVLDDEGAVKALYTDTEGHDLKGDYDLVPIVNSFVEEHPDFSYKGRKGIVSVSGSEGVFGYGIEESALTNAEQNRQDVTEIAEALREEGWDIACAGYTHSYMNEMSVETLEKELTNWEENVGSLVGETDILFYPYGGEVEYPSDQLEALLKAGYIYLCGIWSEQDFMELTEDYMRQTRRFVDGYTLQNAYTYFTDLFDATSLLDSERT